MRLAGQILALASLSALAGTSAHPSVARSIPRQASNEPSPLGRFASTLDAAGATDPVLSRRRRRRLRGKRAA